MRSGAGALEASAGFCVPRGWNAHNEHLFLEANILAVKESFNGGG